MLGGACGSAGGAGGAPPLASQHHLALPPLQGAVDTGDGLPSHTSKLCSSSPRQSPWAPRCADCPAVWPQEGEEAWDHLEAALRSSSREFQDPAWPLHCGEGYSQNREPSAWGHRQYWQRMPWRRGAPLIPSLISVPREGSSVLNIQHQHPAHTSPWVLHGSSLHLRTALLLKGPQLTERTPCWTQTEPTLHLLPITWSTI